MTPFIEGRLPAEIPPPLTHFSATPNPPTTPASIPPAAQRGRGGTSGRAGRGGRATRGTRGSARGRQRNVSSSTRDQERTVSPGSSAANLNNSENEGE